MVLIVRHEIKLFMAPEKEAREKLIESLIKEGCLKNDNVIRAFGKVDRENFVIKGHKKIAYADRPLPITGNVTISAPHMHAIVLELLDLKVDDDVLEIGFGSGILLAYISEIVRAGRIVGTEINRETYEFGKSNLENAGYRNVELINRDITKHNSESSDKYIGKFDRIVVSAAARAVPEKLVKMLKNNGRMIIPVGEYFQNLFVIDKKGNKIIKKNAGGVAFVRLE